MERLSQPAGAPGEPSTSAGAENPRGPTSPYVDPLGEPFLHTRFVPPARPATFLRRPRLAAHLDQSLDTPLTMVNGSAGAGKTLLVADWAARLGQPVAWFTDEAGDQGAGTFWAYVLHALRLAGVPLSARVGCPADAGRVDHGLLARLAAELSELERPVLLVLDEFDRQPARQVAEDLEFVLHHAAPGLRLVLVTRTEPLLPLHRYRAAGAITEIRDAELAFTPGEAAALLDRHELRLPDDAVRALVERTRGWAAGLRLCALAARESGDPEAYLREFEAGRSTIADFLLAEVLKRQPAGTQDLLLRVSVVDRFCPGLVRALTGRDGLEPVPAGLHRQNAFVEDLGHSWYRLHPLFAEILRAHLRERAPHLEPELHRRAARWLRDSGALPRALAHSAAAQDWEFAAGALVGDLAIGQLFTGLRADDLAGLFGRMAPEAAGTAAELVRAALELSRNDVERGLSHLRRAEGRLAAQRAPGAAERLSCVLLETLAARLTGSPCRAERAVAAASELRHEVPARLLEEHPELLALLLTHLGSARVWAGSFDAARAALSEVVGHPGGPATALPRQDCLAHLALIDYLEGRLESAEREALAAKAETERFGLGRPAGAALGRLVLAALAVERDELDQAEALLAEAAACGPAAPDPVTAAGRSLATARLLLARGDPQAALEAAAPAVTVHVASPWAELGTALVASAAHLAEGRPDTALKVLEHVPHGGEPECTAGLAWARLAAGDRDAAIGLVDRLGPPGLTGTGVSVRAALVRARVAEEAGDVATARKLLARALLEGRRERLRRPFLDAGPGIRRLVDTPPLQSLAAGWLTPGGPRPRDDGAAEPGPLVVEELSGREREVVRCLGQLMTTEEIAADLYVSVNTVKTHLKSAYRKLGVSRRGEAVRQARARGLL
ncbi:LuxR C-terminal-related transcriptional regulator [Streptomyces bungoensis]|uniref:LuxR C-terminal-related transcriptional regulator n=1 Tax=Streptomyces bungoensis TaxID=285568 RepID=UPI003F4CC5A1